MEFLVCVDAPTKGSLRFYKFIFVELMREEAGRLN